MEEQLQLVQNPFLWLPIEVSTKIFSFLSPTTRQNNRVVCAYWKQILDEIPTAVVNNENYKLATKLTRVIFAKVQNLTAEFQDPVVFKQYIQRLEFWGVVVSYNLLHFLGECNLIKELSFGKVTLDSYRKMECPEGLTLPNVKVMNFELELYVQLTVHEVILFDLLRQIRFMKLEQVEVRRANRGHYHYRNYDAQMINLPSRLKSSAILGFLVENSRTLKTFIASSSWLNVLGFTVEEFGDDLKKLQIENLTCHTQKDGEFIGNEAAVVGSQRNLKKLDISCDDSSWPSVTRGIQSSADSLTDVTIFFNYLGKAGAEALTKFDPSDASIFKECSKLKTLSWFTQRPVNSLNSLPESIQILFLGAVLTKEVLMAIASRLCNLKSFIFSGFIRPGNVNPPLLEIDLDFLQPFIKIKTLEHLEFTPCEDGVTSIVNFADFLDGFQVVVRSFGMPFCTFTINHLGRVAK